MSGYEGLKFEDISKKDSIDTIGGKPVDEYTLNAIRKFRSKHNL